MILQQCHNAPTHRPPRSLSRGCGARDRRLPHWAQARWWGTAGYVEQTVVAVLHLMQHLLRLRELLLRRLVHRVQQGDLLHKQVPLAL